MGGHTDQHPATLALATCALRNRAFTARTFAALRGRPSFTFRGVRG